MLWQSEPFATHHSSPPFPHLNDGVATACALLQPRARQQPIRCVTHVNAAWHTRALHAGCGVHRVCLVWEW
jgi:hypothetical protein